MNAYTGKILNIDLSSGEAQSESIADTVYEQFLSGLGLGVYYLYKHMPTGCDPIYWDS